MNNLRQFVGLCGIIRIAETVLFLVQNCEIPIFAQQITTIYRLFVLVELLRYQHGYQNLSFGIVNSFFAFFELLQKKIRFLWSVNAIGFANIASTTTFKVVSCTTADNERS